MSSSSSTGRSAFYNRPIRKKPMVKKRPYVRKNVRPQVPQALKVYVKRQIHNQIENKATIQSETLEPVYNYLNNSANFLVKNVLALLPTTAYNSVAIAQGTGQGGRIGNKIKPVKYTLDMIFYPAQYDATYNPFPEPQDIRIMIFKLRCGQVLTTDLSSDFFQSGNDAFGLTGYLTDMLDCLNKDTKIVYKDFMIKVGYQIFTTTGTQTVFSGCSNNDYKLNRKVHIDLLPFVPKTWIFDDTSAVATNEDIYVVWQAVNALGTAPEAAEDYMTKCSYNACLEYEDA